MKVLVSAESKMIAAFQSRCGCTVTVDDTDVEVLLFGAVATQTKVKMARKASMSFKTPKSTIDSSIVDLRLPIFILFDRHLFPLTSKVQQFQDVIKDHVQRELWLRITTGNVQVG